MPWKDDYLQIKADWTILCDEMLYVIFIATLHKLIMKAYEA